MAPAAVPGGCATYVPGVLGIQPRTQSHSSRLRSFAPPGLWYLAVARLRPHRSLVRAMRSPTGCW